MQAIKCEKVRFNTQPHEGGCSLQSDSQRQEIQFQHTAARRRLQVHQIYGSNAHGVSTHSRTKAAARQCLSPRRCDKVSTHSRTKAAALLFFYGCFLIFWFQHTAARRRLRQHKPIRYNRPHVSTHSRTKAAVCGSSVSATN